LLAIKIKELNNELASEKAKYGALEKVKNREIEEIRNIQEVMRKSSINREVHEINLKFFN